MKPDYNSKGQREASARWYDRLDQLEKWSVNKKITNIQNFVRSRSRTQFSKNMGIELVYAVRERIMK